MKFSCRVTARIRPKNVIKNNLIEKESILGKYSSPGFSFLNDTDPAILNVENYDINCSTFIEHKCHGCQVENFKNDSHQVHSNKVELLRVVKNKEIVIFHFKTNELVHFYKLKNFKK